VHCQFKSQQFVDNLNNTISLKQFITPPKQGEYTYYHIFFNQDYFGDYDDISVAYINNQDSLYVLGKPYASPFKMIYNTDTIYFRNGIVRIKYQNNIYEKIP